MLEMAQREPVRVQKNGRDVGVVLSPEEFARLSSQPESGPSPLVRKLHEDSVKRWGKVYEALSK